MTTAIKLKNTVRIKKQVANCSVGVKQSTENNIGINDYFHLMNRSRFFNHQPFFTFLASLSTSDCLALDLDVASL
jgi:hypothetical protein